MTDEYIRKLARDYAEDVFGKEDYPFKEDDMCNAEDDFESVVAFLSKKFCIVEKSVMDKLNIVYRAKAYNLVCLNKDDVEALFGKELFNDTEK
ncbi:MAG: hypothetical protein K2H46_02560 [Muribaculaceae bacterium]|nr:hypothetical protein [Muribaculaceae bacterium]